MKKLTKPFYIYFNKSSPKNGGKKGIALQYAIGLFLLLLGLLLSIPMIPGPGFIFVALGLLLLQLPGSSKLLSFLDKKHGFHKFKQYLIDKFNIHLIY